MLVMQATCISLVGSTKLNIGSCKEQLSNFSGTILYVGGGGPGNYTRIQDAIDNASDGDTVFVYNDSSPYIENVVVDKSLDIVGEEANSTIVSSYYGSTFQILADHVLISGFSITTIGNNPQYLHVGIDASGSYSVFKGNKIYHNNIGIWLDMATSMTIIDNDLGDDGILISGGRLVLNLLNWASHTIINNTVNGKPIYYYSNINDINVPDNAGQVIVANCSNIQIQNLNCSYVSAPIQIGFSSNIILAYNNISYSEIYGILCFNSFNNVFNSNTIYNSSLYGMYLINSPGNTFSRNIVSATQPSEYSNAAWELEDSSDNVLLYNQIINNGCEGLILHNSHNNLISLNYIGYISNPEHQYLQFAGISLFGSNSNIIQNNTINNNDYWGMTLSAILHTNGTLQGSLRNIVANNTLIDNYEGIVIAFESDQNIISHNNVQRSHHSAILVTDWCDNNTIENNDCNGGSKYSYGLDNTRASNNNIYSNNTVRGFTEGFSLGGSKGITLTKNAILSNTLGIKIANVRRTKILSNTFFNNSVDARFQDCYVRWLHNYWDKPRVLPKVIIGRLLFFPVLAVDWFPASNPPEPIPEQIGSSQSSFINQGSEPRLESMIPISSDGVVTICSSQDIETMIHNNWSNVNEKISDQLWTTLSH